MAVSTGKKGEFEALFNQKFPTITWKHHSADINLVHYVDCLLFKEMYKGKIVPVTKTEKAEACNIVRFAMTEILGWSEEDAKEHITDNIMEKFRLTEYAVKYIAKNVNVPEKLKFDGNYILEIAFSNASMYNDDIGVNIAKRKGGSWGKHQLVVPNLGNENKNWIKPFEDMLSEMFNIDSTERLYFVFSNRPEILKRINGSRPELGVLMDSCFHPVEILDSYLTEIDRQKAVNGNFDTDLGSDEFCYTAALFRSIINYYSKYNKRFMDPDDILE